MALAVLLGTATVGSGVALMVISAFLISAAALQPSIAVLQVPIVAVRFFGISRGVFRYLERLVSHTITLKLLARLRVWFYRAVEPLAPARLVQTRSADLLSSIVADINVLENFYIRVLAPPLVGILVGLGMWVYLSRFDVTLGFVLLLFYILIGTGVPILVLFLGRTPGRQVVTRRANLYHHLVDGIQGMAEVVAYGQEQRRLQELISVGDAYATAERRLAWISALQRGLVDFLTNLGMWVIVVLGVTLVVSRVIDGVFLAGIALGTLASFEAVRTLPEAAQIFESSFESARRLFGLVDMEPPLDEHPAEAPQVDRYDLEVRGLTFKYGESDPPALMDLTFSIPEGGRVAIVGPSGAGKTSLVNVLLRFWPYQSGEIRLGDVDLRRFPERALSRHISVVSQDTYLFNATVRENLLLARPEASREELIHAARQAQIHAFLETLPDGYETYIGEQGVKLSGGQRQRLAIARALVRRTPILILDEPTANLDALTEQAVLDTLLELMTGKTTLLITHRLVRMEAMDEILVLNAGRLVERGRHEQLSRGGGLYQQMWAYQNQILRW